MALPVSSRRMRPLGASPAPRGLVVLLLAALLCVASCMPQATPLPPPDAPIRDLSALPQKPSAFLDPATAYAPIVSPDAQAALAADFAAKFFAPWDRYEASTPPAQLAESFAAFEGKAYYGENRLPKTPGWTERLKWLADMESFPNKGQKGITVRRTDQRVLPTDKPLFLDFARAGEGYPFDYNQNSALAAGTPVFIAHASADGAWYFCEGGASSGWVKVEDVAVAEDAFIRDYRTGGYAAMTWDNMPLSDAGGAFRVHGRIGDIFPIVSEDADSYRILLPVKTVYGSAQALPTRLSRELGAKMPLPFTPADVAKLADNLIGEPYGWGGLYGNRDCSALLRDLFAPFGVWLPRNSQAQAQTGTVIPLDAPDDEAKERLIRERGVPFATLLGMPGHIMLYIGQSRGQAVVFHDLWAVRTFSKEGEGRRFVGRVAVTTLAPGAEYPDAIPSASLRSRVKTMTLLPEVR